MKCLIPWKTCGIDWDLETHPVGAGIQIAGSRAGSGILSPHVLLFLLECRVSFIFFFGWKGHSAQVWEEISEELETRAASYKTIICFSHPAPPRASRGSATPARARRLPAAGLLAPHPVPLGDPCYGRLDRKPVFILMLMVSRDQLPECEVLHAKPPC